MPLIKPEVKRRSRGSWLAREIQNQLRRPQPDSTFGFFLRKSVMRDHVLSRSTTRRSDLSPSQSSDNQRPPSGRLFSNSSSSSSDAAAPRRSPGPTGVSSLVDERLLAFLMKQHADAAAAGLMPPLAGLPTSMAPSGEPREAGEAHCATSAASGLPLGVLSTLVSCVLLSTVARAAELVHSQCAQLQVRSPVGRDLCSMINLGAVEVSPFPPLSPSFFAAFNSPNDLPPFFVSQVRLCF